ncbi:MAG: copper amine oxidase N-terminal domain-containing protein [Armatimonadetes bacterium]|nr:copper amine oxidase N-terminal domain-containing protein [Armatimonadota bacterium]
MNVVARTTSASLLLFVMWTAVSPAAVTETTPRFLYASLLNAFQWGPNTAMLQLDRILVALPKPPEGHYSPDDGGKLWAVLSGADGAQLARLDCYADPGGEDMWTIQAYKVTGAPDVAGEGSQVKLAPGEYRLEFFLESGRFCTFPFAVSRLTEGGRDYFFLEGDWGDWAYLLYADADPEQALQWKVWLRNKAAIDRRSVKVWVEIIRDADNQVVCTCRPDVIHDLTPQWVRYAFDMIHPMQGTGGGAYLKAAELLKTDGSYTLKMTIDGKPYGTWKFAIAGGRLSRAGRTDPAGADPLTYIEGGDAWWYEGETTAAEAGSSEAPPPPAPTLTFIPDAQPLVVDGTAMLAADSLLNWLRAIVKTEGGRITATTDEHRLEMTVGTTAALVDGQAKTAPAAPVERDGEVYVPIRFASEALGAQFQWDAATKTMTIIEGHRMAKVKLP